MMDNRDDKFEEVYKTHFRDIYKYVYRLVQNSEVAEDITQDVFCAALDLGEKFMSHENRRVGSWLLRKTNCVKCAVR